MDPERFAHEFGALYRELYRLAVRRVDDAREVMSAETTALLLHLSQTGPLTLSELARHLDRAPSTLSAKVSELESRGLLARQRDEQDSRRAQLWLSPKGRRALLAAVEVLDSEKLAAAAQAMDVTHQTQLLEGLRALLAALPTPRRTP
jgi:DNA-binding MarR family transcriptional regulator